MGYRSFGDDEPGDDVYASTSRSPSTRYRTTRMLTLDQRHLRRLRPLRGAEYFAILPYDPGQEVRPP
jgi:hypothetical protein